MLVTSEQKRVVTISRAKYEGWVRVMSGMVTQEKLETWMGRTEEPAIRRGKANEMLDIAKQE